MKESEIASIWKEDKKKYKCLADSFCIEIKTVLKDASVLATINFRLKELDSIIKKIIMKKKNYEDIHDKLGFRVIVKFQNDLELVDKKIQEYFGERISNIDDKSKSLSDNVFGYQSIHYDFFEKEQNLYFELQLRTICQHNWSLMSHELSYKSEEFLPIEIRRRINALSALFEVADAQFQGINDSVLSIKSSSQFQLACFLEAKFLKLAYRDYDREMTNYFLTIVEELYGEADVFAQIESFYNDNLKELGKSVSRSSFGIFYSQPEILIILERIVNKKILLKKKWESIYPIEYLEDIANSWGVSLD